MAPAPTDWVIEQSSYLRWIEHCRSKRRPPSADTGPLISVVMPVFDTPLRWLHEAVASVVAQDYPHWQLCIADDGSTEPWVGPELRRWAASDPRISIRPLERNVGIAAASNAALELARGEFVALMDHDDVIPPHALGTVAAAIHEVPDARLIYTDSDHLDGEGERCTPFFKPDWDYVRFLGQNYLNHLTVIRSDVLEQIDGWREGYEGSQDYDLYLRVIEVIDDDQVHHIPDILYHWRDVPSSKARANLADAVRAARRAIEHHLVRQHASAEVKGAAGIYNRVNWGISDRAGPVLVVLHGRDARQLAAAEQRMDSAASSLSVSWRSHDESAVTTPLGSFVNDSIRSSHCETIVVLDAALVATTDQWLERLVALGNVAGTGVVGAQCSSENGDLYALPRFRDRLPRYDVGPHAHDLGLTSASRGYVANLALDQSVDFVSPDVVAFTRDVFDDIGGFVEDAPEGLDAEAFCAAAVDAGYRNVWSPHVRFRMGRRANAQGGAGSERAHADEGRPEPRLPEIFLDTLLGHELLEWDIAWTGDQDASRVPRAGRHGGSG